MKMLDPETTITLHLGGRLRQAVIFCLAVTPLLSATGCYVPLRSPAIQASSLPDEFRTPTRSFAQRLNFSNLSVAPPVDYLLGPNDILDVLVPGLFEAAGVRPLRVRVMADGTVSLPLVGPVSVGGMNLADAQRAIDLAYTAGRHLVNPRVSVSLTTKATIDIAVLGEVKTPGVFSLPRYQNDISHAIALAGGLNSLAAETIEVHRRRPASKVPEMLPSPANASLQNTPVGFAAIRRLPPIHRLGNEQPSNDVKIVLAIPLRGGPATISVNGQPYLRGKLTSADVTLEPGDTLVIPRQPDEVFFVTGPVSRLNAVNFTVTDRDRQLGSGFIIPRDRDIDVVTAVSMAGYIDPIESPSTVTVQRALPGRPPLLVHVDLIKARYSWQENIYVEPGDIIYLNPDGPWWFRRTFDRIVPDLFLLPYGSAMSRLINPFRTN